MVIPYPAGWQRGKREGKGGGVNCYGIGGKGRWGGRKKVGANWIIEWKRVYSQSETKK